MITFIVNLKEHIIRYTAIKNQLDNTNLNYHFIEAVNGIALSDKELKKIVHDYPACNLTKGEIGCALSHIKIYQKIIDDNIEHALILEDDAILPHNIEYSINNIVQLDNKNKPNVYLLSEVMSYIKNKRLHTNIFKAYDAYGTYGYIINRKAAERLLAVLQPIKYEADLWSIFRSLGYTNVYCAIPHLINTRDHEKIDSCLESERALVVKQRKKYLSKVKKESTCYQLYRIKEMLLKKYYFKLEKGNHIKLR